ncbi:MAG: DoxX family protein [Desulfuromonadaceae bacterium]|nr:DoxX family protein [Desulfuromonadaceae bacterium]
MINCWANKRKERQERDHIVFTTLKRIFTSEELYRNWGLLLLRVGIGGSMIFFHGYAKLTGGPEVWEQVGASMGIFGIHTMPMLWGALAAMAEFFGSLLLIFGILFRPAALGLAGTMVVAVFHHLHLPADHAAAGWAGASHALELACVYTALLLTGPGRFRISRW